MPLPRRSSSLSPGDASGPFLRRPPREFHFGVSLRTVADLDLEGTCQAVVGTLQELGLWFDFDQLRFERRNQVMNLDAPEALAEKMVANPTDILTVRSRKAARTRSNLDDWDCTRMSIWNERFLRMGKGGVRFSVHLHGSELEGVLSHLGTLSASLILRVAAALPDLVVCPPATATVVPVNPPLPRPPRALGWWPCGPVQAVDMRAVECAPQDLAAQMKRVVAAARPPGVQTRREGGVVADVWIDDMRSVEEVEATLSDQIAWYGDVVEAEIRAGFNELGDRRISMDLVNTAQLPFVFLDLANARGLVPVVTDGSAVVAGPVLEALGMLGQLYLPNGGLLAAVDLILPTREEAVASRAWATSVGAGRTLYIGSDNQLWDPYPAGAWRK